MAGIFGYSREAVRVKVKKCEGLLQPEFRKFSVDPQITSFEVLQSILAKAFDIKGEFTICYRTFDDCGHEIHLSILSDWDLDAAFLRAHNTSLTNCSEPSLCLRVDMKPFEETCDEWDVTTNIPATINTRVVPSEIKATQRLPGLIMNQVERTFNMVQRALNLGEDGNVAPQPPRQPLSDSEFRRFLDPVGQIKHAKDLRSVIYYGGIDPSLRKVVWKHILNVYPDGMSGRERMDYMKRKASEYYALRDTWKDLLQRGPVTGDLAYTTGMVRKDVLRTDRHHRFYAGSDDNQNIASLFNILTTYALNHPKVSYCQGMSDLASPLLVTMGDEAHAYICFCALMSRLGHNFMLDGIAMTQKFTHLAEALLFYDPEFYNYLKSHQADDLLFCYRWLLLEMKREFAFDDSLRMLEVLWSSLPATPPSEELKLYETEFKPLPVVTPPISPLIKTPRENAYTKVCALRRQSSSMSIASWAAGTTQKSHTPIVKRQNHSLDETLGRTFFKNTLHEAKTFQSLDDTSVTLSSTTETYTEDTGRDTNLKTVSTVDSRSRSTSPSEIKSESNDRFDRQDSMKKLSSSMSNLVNKSTIVKKGHFRDLKERIAAGKRGIFGSTEKLDSADVIKEEQENSERKPKGRMVKNLNEFLSFASNKNRIGDNFSNGEIRKNDDKPVITLTGSSFDESVSDSKFSAGSSGRDSFDGSSPDDSQEYFPMTTSMTRELRLELENLDRQVFGSNYRQHGRPSPNESESSGDSSSTVDDDVASCDCLVSKPSSEIADGSTLTEVAEIGSVGRSSRARTEIDEKVDVKKYSDDIFVWENPLHRRSPADRVRSTKYPSTPDEQAEELEYDGESGEIFEETQTQGGIKSVTPIRLVRKSNSIKKEGVKPCKVDVSDSSDSDVQEQVKWKSGLQQERLQNGDIQQMTNSCEEATENAKNSSSSLLPSPQDFGGGNPFLMFLCVTVLLQHRDYVMRNGMDYNEMAMHFDKMVRKHDVTRVLNQARRMFANYMRLHGANNNPATNGGDVDI